MPIFVKGVVCGFKMGAHLPVLIVRSLMCESPMPWALLHPRAVADAGFGNVMLVTVWVVLFFLVPENREHPLFLKG